MGSKCSPEICDIRAFEGINEIVEKYKYENKILFYGRYRDDAFIIAHSSREEVKQFFFKIANDHHPLLKSTYEISDEEIIILDTVVHKGLRFRNTGILDIESYTKRNVGSYFQNHQWWHIVDIGT